MEFASNSQKLLPPGITVWNSANLYILQKQDPNKFHKLAEIIDAMGERSRQVW